MKTYLLIAFLIINYSLLIINCSAQSLAPEVIATAGDYYSSPNTTLAWTLGEVVVETYQSANNFLTQGFHQTGSGFETGVAEYTFGEANFSIYPNPFNENFIISFHQSPYTPIPLYPYTLSLYDMMGKKLKDIPYIYSASSSIEIDMRTYAAGFYILTIYQPENNYKQSFHLSKIRW